MVQKFKGVKKKTVKVRLSSREDRMRRSGYVTVSEAAKIAKRPAMTIRNWIFTDKVSVKREGTGKWSTYVNLSSLKEHMKERQKRKAA